MGAWVSGWVGGVDFYSSQSGFCWLLHNQLPFIAGVLCPRIGVPRVYQRIHQAIAVVIVVVVVVVVVVVIAFVIVFVLL